jgi:hypothetical protein
MTTDARAEQYVAVARAALIDIHRALRSNPNNWCSCLHAGLACLSHIDQSRLMLNPDRKEERIWFLRKLQRYGYFDADSGGIPDVARWCELEWNRLLSTDPSNVAALAGKFSAVVSHHSRLTGTLWIGLAEAWLLKAQFWLARIHREEKRAGAVDDAAHERRLQTENYVEARTFLQPSVDLFANAVDQAREQGLLTGPLLAKVRDCLVLRPTTRWPLTGRRQRRRPCH